MFSKPVDKYVGLILVATGAALVIVSATIALQSFYGYTVRSISGLSLEDTITSLVNVLVELAVKLGFLGVVVWAGSILLKNGIQALRPAPASK